MEEPLLRTYLLQDLEPAQLLQDLEPVVFGLLHAGNEVALGRPQEEVQIVLCHSLGLHECH